jgi:hypothetical protein
MRKWIFVTAILVLGGVGQASAIVYDDGGIHEINTSVPAPIDLSAGTTGPTTLKVLAGASVIADDAIGAAGTHAVGSGSGGIVDVWDGSLIGGNASGSSAHSMAIYISGGTVNLHGGTISAGNAGGDQSGNAHAYGIDMAEGTLNFSGGTIVGGNAISSSSNAHGYGIYNSRGTVNMSGGTLVVGNDYGSGSDNTTVHGIYNTQHGVVNITGGSLANGDALLDGYLLLNSQAAVMNISGGTLLQRYSFSNDAFPGISNSLSGVVNIYGTNFNLPYGTIAETFSGRLTGTLADGSAIDTTISNYVHSVPLYPTPATINLLPPVPEPSAVVLIGLGVLGLLAWGRQRR